MPIVGIEVRVDRHRPVSGFGNHPHMLRYASGYKLANDGTNRRAIQAYSEDPY